MDIDRNLGYNKNLRPFANDLRHRMTRAEVFLWKHALRASGVKGYQFRRQRPVLNYIADFMCKGLRLIIEVDGFSHSFPEQLQKDMVRQKRLEGAGFIVIRFSDNEVLDKFEWVVKEIENVITKIESSPGPAPGGGSLLSNEMFVQLRNSRFNLPYSPHTPHPLRDHIPVLRTPRADRISHFPGGRCGRVSTQTPA